MKHYTQKQSTNATMNELTEKFYLITGNILCEYTIRTLKTRVEKIKNNGHKTGLDYDPIGYNESQLQELRDINKIALSLIHI